MRRSQASVAALVVLLAAASCGRGAPRHEVGSGAATEPPEIPGVEVPELPDVEPPDVSGLPGSPDAATPTTGGQPAAPAEPTSATPPSTEPPTPPSTAAPRSAQTCGPVTLFALEATGGRPSGIAAGDGGSVWFTDPGTGTIGRLDPNGTVARFPLRPKSQPFNIARAPNGDFWFTNTPDRHQDPSDASLPSVGRITPLGEVTEFSLPTVEGNPMGVPDMGSAPMGIAAGPDGAMWFTEAGADQIGRVTPDGAITEIPLPRRDRMHAHPSGITAGPDGAVWFSEPLLGIVARIDVRTHAITEFALPRGGSGLVGANSLAAGPGGALWYEDPGGSAIGRVSTDGKVRSFPLASSLWRPWSVTTGPDGNVWFLETFDGKVVRMTPEGKFTDWAAPAEAAGIGSGSAAQMTAGSDGAMWFAAPSANRIGRIACSG